MAAQTRIPLSEPVMSGREAEYLGQCIEDNWVSPRGPFVARFEQAFAERHGRDGAVAVNTGTAALHMALVSLGIGPGDEVIIPTLTFVASANPVRYVGATPVLVDVARDGFGVDPASVADAVTPSTKAIVAVHLYGHPADMGALAGLAHAHDIALVEDATEALGSYRGDDPAGTLSDIGCFSFNGNKVITSGSGGMLLAREPDRLAHMRHLAFQAREPGREYLHDEVGFNYGMANIQAAVGLAQFEHLDERLELRRAIGERYADALEDIPGLRFVCGPDWGRWNHWLQTVLVDADEYGESPPELMDRLAADGIETRPFFYPLHLLPPYHGCAAGPLPVAEELHRQGVCIPSSANLDEGSQERVIAALRRQSR